MSQKRRRCAHIAAEGAAGKLARQSSISAHGDDHMERTASTQSSCSPEKVARRKYSNASDTAVSQAAGDGGEVAALFVRSSTPQRPPRKSRRLEEKGVVLPAPLTAEGKAILDELGIVPLSSDSEEEIYVDSHEVDIDHFRELSQKERLSRESRVETLKEISQDDEEIEEEKKKLKNEKAKEKARKTRLKNKQQTLLALGGNVMDTSSSESDEELSEDATFSKLRQTRKSLQSIVDTDLAPPKFNAVTHPPANSNEFDEYFQALGNNVSLEVRETCKCRPRLWHCACLPSDIVSRPGAAHAFVSGMIVADKPKKCCIPLEPAGTRMREQEIIYTAEELLRQRNAIRRWFPPQATDSEPVTPGTPGAKSLRKDALAFVVLALSLTGIPIGGFRSQGDSSWQRTTATDVNRLSLILRIGEEQVKEIEECTGFEPEEETLMMFVCVACVRVLIDRGLHSIWPEARALLQRLFVLADSARSSHEPYLLERSVGVEGEQTREHSLLVDHRLLEGLMGRLPNATGLERVEKARLARRVLGHLLNCSSSWLDPVEVILNALCNYWVKEAQLFVEEPHRRPIAVRLMHSAVAFVGAISAGCAEQAKRHRDFSVLEPVRKTLHRLDALIMPNREDLALDLLREKTLCLKSEIDNLCSKDF